MKLDEITAILEKEFPLTDALEWDNSGLLIGDRNSNISTVLLTLDVTEKTLIQAKKAGAELIISHHPILFGGTKRITSDTAEGRLICGLIQNGIAVYAAHTNCDVGKRGINARLAEMFELSGAVPLEGNGLGRMGDLKKALTFSELCSAVKEKLDTPFLRVFGDRDIKIKRLAVASGASADSIPTACEKGCDAIITGDIKYHEMLNGSELGICIIDAGHYPTESFVTDIFEDILSDTELMLIKAESSDIFRLV